MLKVGIFQIASSIFSKSVGDLFKADSDVIFSSITGVVCTVTDVACFCAFSMIVINRVR